MVTEQDIRSRSVMATLAVITLIHTIITEETPTMLQHIVQPLIAFTEGLQSFLSNVSHLAAQGVSILADLRSALGDSVPAASGQADSAPLDSDPLPEGDS